ncbi:MAG: hypothetical protein J6A16_08645, partial [Oscillospiraceae bacterium]|nr:hypothetical protein [Oscillospiraceae bacterium]
MNDITTSRNINAIVPVSHFGGITPICVPMEHDSSFSDEVTGRFSQRVGSLWDRLGLVFLIEEQQAPVRDNVQHVVNNFSSQIIFQLFSNKNTRRLVEKDQPGFVYLGNILKQYDSRQRSVSEQISREISERIADTDKLAQHVKSIYGALCGDDKSECSAQLLTITLEKLLRERIAIASDKSVISENKLSETEVVLIERLQKTLRSSGGADSTRETRIPEQLSRAADMENAAESRKEILSVISEYIPKTAEAVLQQKAADIVSSAVGSVGAVTDSDSIEGVRKNLAQEIDRLNRAIFDDGVSSVGNGRVLFSDSREAGIQAAEQKIHGTVVAPVTQGYDITRSVTELLQSAADEMASDKMLTAQQRLISSFSGKSIEEIEKRIRTVYEATPKKTAAQAGKVIAAASDVVLSLLARRAHMATDTQMNGMATRMPSTRYSIPVSVNDNTAVMHDKAVHNAASSTYFTDLSSGVEQFYNIDQGDVQGISYREIKRTVSELMKNRSAHATSVKSAAPLNRILHTDKATGFTVAVPHQTINNENNYSDTAYAVSENNYRSYLTDQSDQHVHVDISAAHTDNVQNVRNVTVNGTVLPAEQNSYTLNRSGDTYYAEHHHDGEEHNTSNTSVTNNINTDRTVNNADSVQNVRNVTVNGTVLPA